MQVIDCECGETLQAANDDDLKKIVAVHMQERHANELSEEEINEMIARRAYTATDS